MVSGSWRETRASSTHDSSNSELPGSIKGDIQADGFSLTIDGQGFSAAMAAPDSDPEKNADAVKYNSLSFDEVYAKNLKVMDMTAFTLCMENNLPIVVFDMNTPGNLNRVVTGEKVGTLVNAG